MGSNFSSFFSQLYRPFQTVHNVRVLYGFRGMLISIVNKLCGRGLLDDMYFEEPPHSLNLGYYDTETNTFRDTEMSDEIVSGLNNLKSTSIIIPRSPGSYKARIMLVSHELSRTGAPMVLLKAAKLLVQEGYWVVLFAPKFDNPDQMEMWSDFSELGIPVIMDYHLQEGRFTVPYQAITPASDFIGSYTHYFDLVFCSSFTTLNIIKPLINTDIPVVWWLHESASTYDSLAPFFPQPLSGNIKVICGGNHALKSLDDYHFNVNAEELMYGIEDRKDEFPAVENKKVKFLLPGIISIRKNQSMLLDAIELLPSSVKEKAEFVLVGNKSDFDPDYSDTVVSRCESAEGVTWLPSVTEDGLLRIYQDADCIVLTSLDDPMPVVATYGLMLEKIVLCTDTTGTSAYIRDGVNGFIVDHSNTRKLSDRLQYIIENNGTPQMNALRKEGRKIFDSVFSMEIFKEKLINLIEKMISERDDNDRQEFSK